MVGKWTLDKERTLDEATKSTEPAASQGAGEGLLSDIAGGVQKGIFRVLLTQLEGVEIEFTSTEFKRTHEGVGETRTYEIVERPEKDVFIVKTADGRTNTWTRTDTGIRMKFTDEGDRWVYFSPAE